MNQRRIPKLPLTRLTPVLPWHWSRRTWLVLLALCVLATGFGLGLATMIGMTL